MSADFDIDRDYLQRGPSKDAYSFESRRLPSIPSEGEESVYQPTTLEDISELEVVSESSQLSDTEQPPLKEPTNDAPLNLSLGKRSLGDLRLSKRISMMSIFGNQRDNSNQPKLDPNVLLIFSLVLIILFPEKMALIMMFVLLVIQK